MVHIFKQLHGGILLIAGFGCRPAVGGRWAAVDERFAMTHLTLPEPWGEGASVP